MGVGARMLIRRTGRALTQSELDDLCGRIRTDLPDNRFLCGPDLYDRAHEELSFCPTVGEYRAWLRGINHEQQGIDELIGPDGIDLSTLGDHLSMWDQDGPFIIAREGEQFIEAHPFELYFHEDYPRGHWPRIEAVTQWLEKAFPDDEIWYGGDSSGFLAFHLTPSRREQLGRLFASQKD